MALVGESGQLGVVMGPGEGRLVSGLAIDAPTQMLNKNRLVELQYVLIHEHRRAQIARESLMWLRTAFPIVAHGFPNPNPNLRRRAPDFASGFGGSTCLEVATGPKSAVGVPSKKRTGSLSASPARQNWVVGLQAVSCRPAQVAVRAASELRWEGNDKRVSR